jgi:uncharacterized membrane protein YphA (DoxX/SURF4 family)
MPEQQRAIGLAITRIIIGTFFVFEGLDKLSWFTDTSILAERFSRWLAAVGPDSASGRYLEAVAIPGTVVFARLVPLGELCSGLALVLGISTRLFSAVALFMVLNFHFASGALFAYSFLTNGYGLPVVASTLGLAIGGHRLPWSVKP